MSKTAKAIIIVLIILALGLGVYYYLKQGKVPEEKPGVQTEEKAAEAPKAGIDVGAGTTKPLEKMPETNPYKNVVNPFEQGYKNPFK